MKEHTRPHVAVLMGDLIRSESSLPIEFLHDNLNVSVSEQNLKSIEDLISPLTITLGDEFQGLFHSLAKASLAARNLRLRLMKVNIDCRFVVGTARIATQINQEKAWNMMGPGLSRARGKLNQKKNNLFYSFSLPENTLLESVLDGLGYGLSVIERGWTNQQRDDISDLLDGKTPSEIAEERNVSIHSIYKVRSSGNFDAYVAQWEAVTLALEAVDHEDEGRA